MMFETYRQLIADGIPDPQDRRLLIAERGKLAVHYSPFDHVATQARIAIVGITPGAQQSANALAAAHRVLASGGSSEEALAVAKSFASFSGPMRSNLVAMLDHVGVNGWLGVATTGDLWDRTEGAAHFTSVLRYPVFVDGRNYAGSSPDMARDPLLAEQADRWFGSELDRLADALWVPLGDKVARALAAAAARRGRTIRLLDGLPHPSGANAERIAYFLGRKPRGELSVKTDPGRIDAGKARAMAVVEGLAG